MATLLPTVRESQDTSMIGRSSQTFVPTLSCILWPRDRRAINTTNTARVTQCMISPWHPAPSENWGRCDPSPKECQVDHFAATASKCSNLDRWDFLVRAC